MPSPRFLLTALLASLALVLAACGGDDEDTSASNEPATAEQAADAKPADVGSMEISEDLEEKPSITPPEGDPPAELESRDIVKGKGTAARDGDNVSVQYIGVNWSNGAEFDASWTTGQPFTFTLGSGGVIPGWEEGVKGMKEGGRRLLVIPPDKGYGPGGTPDGSIPPNETLIFVVDLEKIERGQ